MYLSTILTPCLETLHLTGSIDALQAWDPVDALALSPESGDTWTSEFLMAYLSRTMTENILSYY